MYKILFTVLLALAVVTADDDSNGACKGKDQKFVRHPSNCQAYYSCVKGVGTEYQCKDGFYFDEENQWCDKKERVDCKITEPPQSKCPKDGVHNIPKEGECNKYILCVEGKPYEQFCADGLWFDEKEGVCDLEERVNCNTCPLKDDPLKPKFLPNKFDCNKYYVCMDRKRISFSCTPELHFSEKTKQCMEPEDAECKYVENSTEDVPTDKP